MGFRVVIETKETDADIRVTDARTEEEAVNAAWARVLIAEGDLFGSLSAGLGQNPCPEEYLVSVTPIE